jgi:hypothetical protein
MTKIAIAKGDEKSIEPDFEGNSDDLIKDRVSKYPHAYRWYRLLFAFIGIINLVSGIYLIACS